MGRIHRHRAGGVLHPVPAIQLYCKQQYLRRRHQRHQHRRQQGREHQQYVRQSHQHRQVQKHPGASLAPPAGHQPCVWRGMARQYVHPGKALPPTPAKNSQRSAGFGRPFLVGENRREPAKIPSGKRRELRIFHVQPSHGVLRLRGARPNHRKASGHERPDKLHLHKSRPGHHPKHHPDFRGRAYQGIRNTPFQRHQQRHRLL